MTPLRWAVGLLLLVFAAPVWAEGPIVKQSQCRATWTAPQANADGTNLIDLKEYRIYVADTPAGAASALLVPTKVVPAPEANPPAAKTGEWLCRGPEAISVGQKYATISAADVAGNESPRSVPFPFESADDVSPQAPTLFQVQAGP